MEGKHRERGFTLTELLVSTAIFAIMMSAIVALFVASLHAVKASYLASDAYETSRGAFNVVERDLTTVFTMRDYGDYYQFFGTPQGMTMIGLIRRPPNAGDTEANTTLGRITYVIYPVVVKDPTNAFRVTTPWDLPQLNTRPVPVQEDDGTGNIVDVPVGTAALVRFIEPGVEDLDSYPFDWEDLFVDPEFGTTIKSELDLAIRDELFNNAQDSSDPNILVRLSPIQQERLAAKKRELWIRMLAGQEYWIPLLSGGAPQLPDVWGDGLLATDPTTGGPLVLNPRDFAVAENIGLETPVLGAHGIPLHPLHSAIDQNFFRYGRVLATTQIDQRPTWNSELNEISLQNVGSPLVPRLPEMVTLRLPFAYERPYPTAPQFERNLEQIIDVPVAYTRTALTSS